VTSPEEFDTAYDPCFVLYTESRFVLSCQSVHVSVSFNKYLNGKMTFNKTNKSITKLDNMPQFDFYFILLIIPTWLHCDVLFLRVHMPQNVRF
jgi:hypothetical protein